MYVKHVNPILKVTAALACVLFLSSLAYGHSHLEADYVPWGVDEYELFGLTKSDLCKNFKGKLDFDEQFTHAHLSGYPGPQFLLTFAGDRVSIVRRMFIDGGGCHIMGPILKSKKEALIFSIDGLSKLPHGGDKADRERLACARRLLGDIQNPQKLSKTVLSNRH